MSSTGAGTLTLGGNVTFTSTGNPLALDAERQARSRRRQPHLHDQRFEQRCHRPDDRRRYLGHWLGLIKAGAGTLLLSGANTYTGTTTNNLGTLALSGGSAIANTGAVTLANVAGVILDVQVSETIGSLSGGGTTGGNVTLGSNTLTLGDATNTTFSGIISGVGGALTKQGSGILTLSGANTYSGDTTINNGTLRLGAADQIADASDIIVGASGIFDLNNFNETVSSLNSAGSVLFGTGNTLTTAGSQIYTGAVTGGTVAMISTGGGDITATNALNNFSGNLSITTTGAASIADANALALGASSAASLQAFALGGNLTVNGIIQATNTSGTPLCCPRPATSSTTSPAMTCKPASAAAGWCIRPVR